MLETVSVAMFEVWMSKARGQGKGTMPAARALVRETSRNREVVILRNLRSRKWRWD